MLKMPFTRMTTALILLLAMLLAASPLTVAQAAAGTVTVVDHGVASWTEVPGCGGTVEYSVTSSYNDVFHMTQLSSGAWQVTYQEEGSVDLVTQAHDYPTYSGHYQFGSSAVLANEKDVAVSTFTFTVHLKGSDGSQRLFTETAHMTVSATGGTVLFDRPSCH